MNRLVERLADGYKSGMRDYRLDKGLDSGSEKRGGSAKGGGSKLIASNRQRKMLKFFNVLHEPEITSGSAGVHIDVLMESKANKDRWDRYLYLTRDFDTDSPGLKEYDEAAIDSVEIPDDWDAGEELNEFREGIVRDQIDEDSPFDNPLPEVVVSRRKFMFTGKFTFGTRAACQAAVVEKGGLAPTQKKASRAIDYLVIGTKGSPAYKNGDFGNKIEAAIISQREHGKPAVISEDHWLASLADQE